MRYRLRGISLISAGKIAIYSLLAAGSAFAQNDRGAITGNITDQDGATVSGAVVQAKNSSSGAIYKATSLSSGDYKFEGLAPGAYEISIPYFGYLAARHWPAPRRLLLPMAAAFLANRQVMRIPRDIISNKPPMNRLK